MQFRQPLLRLPIKFCADTLAAEVRALPADAWEPHPQRFPGNEAVPMVTPAGQVVNDFAGPMGPTRYLLQCSYMMQAMAELDAVWGRGRLMGLGSGAEVPPHVDANYYWRTHIRLHIAAITNPGVDFHCGDQMVNMAPGECWIFDTLRPHEVHNRGSEQRIHLVFDTVGGERLWDLIEAAGQDPVMIEPSDQPHRALKYEQHNYPRIMSPWELRCHLDEMLSLTIDTPPLSEVRRRLDRFVAGWSAAWTQYEANDAGLPAYRDLADSIRVDLERIGGGNILLSNDRPLYLMLDRFVFENLMASPRVIESMTKADQAARRSAA